MLPPAAAAGETGARRPQATAWVGGRFTCGIRQARATPTTCVAAAACDNCGVVDAINAIEVSKGSGLGMGGIALLGRCPATRLEAAAATSSR